MPDFDPDELDDVLDEDECEDCGMPFDDCICGDDDDAFETHVGDKY